MRSLSESPWTITVTTWLPWGTFYMLTCFSSLSASFTCSITTFSLVNWLHANLRSILQGKTAYACQLRRTSFNDPRIFCPCPGSMRFRWFCPLLFYIGSYHRAYSLCKQQHLDLDLMDDDFPPMIVLELGGLQLEYFSQHSGAHFLF
jgi:hypothetical protein